MDRSCTKPRYAPPLRLVLCWRAPLCCWRNELSFLSRLAPLVQTPLLSQVLKAEYWQKGSNKNGAEGAHYFVHYKGWKQTCVVPFVSSPSGARSCTDAAGAHCICTLDACNSRRREADADSCSPSGGTSGFPKSASTSTTRKASGSRKPSSRRSAHATPQNARPSRRRRRQRPRALGSSECPDRPDEEAREGRSADERAKAYVLRAVLSLADCLSYRDDG